ncbi:MAG: (E)-4-hydroxy-3-methylbut-2-enyl-diphosphate synthase [Paludibacteraceae bacterium]|nr:(E)-4-hydroxy-3-methylbut-2-enyl-diphosphate synthase [Paludibacteraceae bacterium]
MQPIDLSIKKRRRTSTTKVGDTFIGSDYPIRIQSMANTDTNDIAASVEQAKRIIVAGGELVRFTTQGIKEVESLRQTVQTLRMEGYTAPIVADVHFNANVADEAAKVVEKVRINPGNYVDPARKFIHLEYTDDEYKAELRRLRERFVRLLGICKENHTALRIGVNHGSLSDRIMSRYGDTPAGMVESCMEFLRVCKEEEFADVVISIKASTTKIMVETVHLLVETMDKEDMHFPLHLGVTEAGEGEDGRLKSALGIGALLADGIGDTIRVSLSEAPEAEIPVAQELVSYYGDTTVILRSLYGDESKMTYHSEEDGSWERFCIHAAADLGRPLFDRPVKQLVIENPNFPQEKLDTLSKDILQAAGIVRYKTEYVSCPSCGRTLFDIEKTIAEVKAATQHLQGLKIGIMGCIVNGPGEMADADYGYVGAGRGNVSLYKGKECVLKNIPREEAVGELVKLIKENGDWKEKE